MLAVLAGVLALAVGALFLCGPLMRVLLALAILPGLGFGTAVLRNWSVAAPVLPYEMTANVEGRLVDLSRSDSGRPRVLLDRVVIHGLEPRHTPAFVRISLDASTPADALVPGVRLLGQARIVAAGRAGGTGRLRFPPLRLVREPRRDRLCPHADARDRGRRLDRGQLTFRLRMALSARIRQLVPGQSGAFAAAILSGDRSGDGSGGGRGAARREPLPHRLDLRPAYER